MRHVDEYFPEIFCIFVGNLLELKNFRWNNSQFFETIWSICLFKIFKFLFLFCLNWIGCVMQEQILIDTLENLYKINVTFISTCRILLHFMVNFPFSLFFNWFGAFSFFEQVLNIRIHIIQFRTFLNVSCFFSRCYNFSYFKHWLRLKIHGLK